MKRRTIKKKVKFEGIGLHSGKKAVLVLHPAECFTGRVIKKNNINIECLAENVYQTENSTSLKKNEETISTVEHFLSAIYILGITDVIFETDNSEFPILNGASNLIINEIKNVGIEEFPVEQDIYVPDSEIFLKNGNKQISLTSAGNLKIAYEINFPYPVGSQKIQLSKIDFEIYKNEIAYSRTFGYVEDYENLKDKGLAMGANYSNTLVLSKKKGYLTKPLSIDECVRHKVLDLIGDIALCGKQINGFIRCKNTGHSEHIQFIKKIRKK